MALVTCPDCENEISDQAKYCPHCGYPINKLVVEWNIDKEQDLDDELVNKNFFKSPKSSKHYTLIWFFILFAIMIIAMYMCDDKGQNSLNRNQAINTNNIVESKYSQGYLNIREEPHENSKIIRTLEPNEKVRTKGVEKNGFVQLLNIEDQPIGWCSNKYLNNNKLSEEVLRNKKNNYQLIQQEKKEIKQNSLRSNKYVISSDLAIAATSEKNFDLMMNCILSDDKQALQTMVLIGQVVVLQRGTVVFLVDPTFSYYKVRQEGTTEYIFINREFLKAINY